MFSLYFSFNMLSTCLGSLDYERRYDSSSRAHDVSPITLSDFGESGNSSAPQYDDIDDVAAEDSDSKDEVSLCYFISWVTCVYLYKMYDSIVAHNKASKLA